MIYIEILYIIVVARVTDLLFRMIADIYNSAINTPEEIMNAVSTSYNIKEDIESLDGIDKVMLFTAYTGSKVGLKDPIKVSSIWNNSKSIKRWRDELIVDKEYMNILRHIVDKDKYVFETEKEPDSLLKVMYEEENIKKSTIYFLKYKYRQKSVIGHILGLKGKTTGFYYISISSKENVKYPNSTILGIRENIARLKRVLRHG